MHNQNSIKSLLSPLAKRWYIIVICLLLSGVAAYRYMQVATPVYQASATIKIEDQTGITETKLFKDFDVFNQNNKTQTEVEVLKSRYLFERALQKLDFFVEYYRVNDMNTEELYHKSPFTVDFNLTGQNFNQQEFDIKHLGGERIHLSYNDGYHNKEVDARFGEQIKGKGWDITVKKSRPNGYSLSDSYRFIIYSKEALAMKMMNTDYIVRAVDKDVNIIKVYYKHPVPEKAMKLVNAVAQAYLEQGLNDKKDLASSTLDFINQQLEIVTQKLNDAQNAIKKYKVDHEIVNIPQQTDATFRMLSQLEIQKVDINMQLSMLANLSEYLRRNKEVNLSGPEYSTIADPLFTESVSKLNNKLREKMTQTARYTENDPHILNLDGEISQLRDYLVESVNNTRKKLMIRQDEVLAAIGEQRASFDGVPEMESTLNELNRNFFLYEKVYNFLIEKRTEALITSQVNVSFNRILEVATLPYKAVAPVAAVVWGIAMFMGLLIGITIAYVRHYIKSSVSSREEMEKVSPIPFIGNVERFAKNTNGYNSFTALTTRILLTQPQQDSLVITVTSTKKGEGKTFIATGVARTMAAMDKKVLLVDMNPYNPTLNEWFDIRNPQGMSDVYINKINIHDVINITAFPNLDMINSGTQESPMSHLIATQRTQDIIKELRSHYDVIVFDTPESGKYVDAIPFMKWSDLNLYVVKADETNKELIANAELVKEEYRLQEVYFVLNAMNEKRNHTGYINTNKLKNLRKNIVPQLTSLFAW
ncbi:MAG: polysaccharide biosynthesis tyrosine autokinase [Bacteroidota bacterium]